MDCSVPGFPVRQEFVQTHVHWAGDAIYISRYRYFTTEAELGPSNQEDGYTLEISILSTGNDRMIFCSEPGQYSLLSWVPDLKKIFSVSSRKWESAKIFTWNIFICNMVAPQGPSVLYILPQVLPVPDWETLSLGTIFCLLEFYVLSSANSARLSFHQELELRSAPHYHFTPGNPAKLKIMSLRNTLFTLYLSSVLYPLTRFFLFIPPAASKSAYLFLFFKIFFNVDYV